MTIKYEELDQLVRPNNEDLIMEKAIRTIMEDLWSTANGIAEHNEQKAIEVYHKYLTCFVNKAVGILNKMEM